jgi:ribosome-associated protein
VRAGRFDLDERDIRVSFVRAGGPGGQHVNKVSTAVQLRYRLDGVSPLPEPVRARLARLAGRRLTEAGEILIEARRFRSQDQNRADARARLAALVERASEPPKPRRATKPPRSAERRRLEQKGRRADVKKLRKPPGGED